MILLIANATVRVGLVWIHYQNFKDAVSETVLFAGTKPDDALRDKVMQIARDNSVPLDPHLRHHRSRRRRPDHQRLVRRTAAILPGYRRPWQFNVVGH